jgi:aminocarboxymuconate-semialdehyde decarboxylase
LAKSSDFARLTNDIYRDAAVRHPGRISAWGCIPLPHVDAALAELEYCLDEAKFAGIGFGCSAAAIPLDAPAFEPIWGELNRRKASVFIHPGQVRSNMPGASDFGLTICVSSPMEMAVAGARLVLSGLSQRYSDVKIILASSGGALPYIHENIQFAAKLFGGEALANVSVRNRLAELYYDTSMSRDPKKLTRLCDLCGSSHIVFGTDAPHVNMAENIAMIREYFNKSEADAILDRNAADILSLHCHIE